MKYLNYKIAYCLILLLTLPATSWAQYSSEEGQFEVSAREACVGAEILVIDPCDDCEQFDFNEDDATDGFDFIYNIAGTYTIKLFAAGGEVTDQVSVTIYENVIPEFTVNRCGSNTVEVRINDNNYDGYEIVWDDGDTTTISGADKEEQHIYTSSGNKTITVQGLYDLGSGTGNCTPGSATVEIVSGIPAASITNIYPLNNQSDKLVIKYDAPDNALYRLQLGINNSDNWIPSYELDPTIDSIVVNDLLLDENYYCFRISTLNACEPGNPPVVFSDALCTQELNVNYTNNQENILTWRTSDTKGTGFDIIIEEAGNLLSTNGLSINTRDYTDQEVKCNTEYCYTLRTNYPNGSTVTSIKKCGIAKLVTTHPAITDVVTKVNNNEIQLEWTEPAPPIAVSFYNISNAVNDGSYNSIATEITAPAYTHTGIDPASNSYCYRIGYEDECGNSSSLSSEICAIYLSGTTTQKVIRLRWDQYTGYNGGVLEYLIEKFDANGSLLGSFSTSATQLSDTLEVGEPQEILYRVTAIPNDGTFENSISNIFTATRRALFTAPTAFTPGSGDENSTFKIISPFLEEMDMKIFNRWGQLMFTTTDPNMGWPGTDHNGNPLPQGTYIYSVKILSENGQMSEASGSVLLLRR